MIVLALAAPGASADQTVAVTTTSGPGADGQCALQEAVLYADGTSEPDCAAAAPTGTTTIRVPAGTYVITATLALTKNAVIRGAGAGSTTLDGGSAVQVLNVAAAATVALDGVKITRGKTGTDATCSGSPPFPTCTAGNGLNGGGIANAGTLTIRDSVVSANSAGSGTGPRSLLLFCTSTGCPQRPGDSAGSGGNGGGIFNTGTLTIAGSTVSQNTAGNGGNGTNGSSGTGSNASEGQNGGNGGGGGSGGGIYSSASGTLTLTDSVISGNTAGSGGNAGSGSAATSSPAAGGNAGYPGFGGRGGGISSLGSLTTTRTAVSENTTGTGGNGASGGSGTGGQPNGSSTVGAPGGSGGGLYSQSGQTATLTNDTFAANTASAGGTGGSGPGAGGGGGALYQVGGGLAQLTFVTIAHNAAAGTGGGIDRVSGTVTEANSVVAANTGAPASNCSGTLTDNGFNLVSGDNSCPGTNADPKLGPLAANGGPTPTMALQGGSAALDEVPVMNCPSHSDQRGVSRPQGAACDAGAYEIAPPVFGSAAATTVEPTSATITGQVTPNLRDTQVFVNYGLTTAYGSSTAPRSVGSGGGPTAFSVPLSGLTRNATYHFRVVARNADGETTGPDATFVTKPLTAKLSKVAVLGPTAALTIDCSGGAPTEKCVGRVKFTSRVTTQGRRTVAVAAAKSKAKPKVTKVVAVATGFVSVPTGKRVTVRVTLNKAGKTLLGQRYKLPTTMSLGGTTAVRRKVTFSYARLRLKLSQAFNFFTGFTVTTTLNVHGIPKGGHLVALCRGRGCPYGRRTFTQKRGAVNLLPSLRGRHLSPGTALTLQITAPNTVGSVLAYRIRSNAAPALRVLCLPPGARRAGTCFH